MAIKEAPSLTKKGDIHGRDEETKQRDAWWSELWDRAKGASLPAVLAQFSVAKKSHFVEIITQQSGEKSTLQIPLVPGIYDKNALKEVLIDCGKRSLSVEAIAGEARERASVTRALAIPVNEGHTGSSTTIDVIPTAYDGRVQFPLTRQPISGTILTIRADNTTGTDILRSKAEYLAALPHMLGAWTNVNGWCHDIPCEEVAHLADEAGMMFDHLRAQIKTLPGVEIYSIVPRWLRYYSDGSMSSQRSGEYGIRNAPFRGGGGLRPLLYDGPAWTIGVAFGKSYIPGRLFINPNGRFICSDWCQRELDKSGGIDLHTGENTKHTLATWLAGPGLSRFGRHDPAIAEMHQVREARGVREILRRKTGLVPTTEALNKRSRISERPAFAELLKEMRRLTGFEHPLVECTEPASLQALVQELRNLLTKGVDIEETAESAKLRDENIVKLKAQIPQGVSSLRILYGDEDDRFGFVANTNKGDRWMAVWVRRGGTLWPHVTSDVLDGPLMRSLSWGHYKITDTETAKRIYRQLLACARVEGARP